MSTICEKVASQEDKRIFCLQSFLFGPQAKPCDVQNKNKEDIFGGFSFELSLKNKPNHRHIYTTEY